MQYIEKVQDSLAKSPKLFWSYHNHILRNRNSPPANTYNKVTATTSQKKALNEYFAPVFLPKPSSKNIDQNMTSKNSELISDIQISELDVEHFFYNLDTTKANGPDRIPPRLLKKFSGEISLQFVQHVFGNWPPSYGMETCERYSHPQERLC